MIVVADASPFIALANIGHTGILPGLFGSVIIPPEVLTELRDPRRNEAVRSLLEPMPPWLQVRAPARVEQVPELHPGECAAISLAEELRADVLLIDERVGHLVASTRGIRAVRTEAVIKQAADMGLIADLRDAFARLMRTDFRVPRQALDRLLEAHLEAKRGSG